MTLDIGLGVVMLVLLPWVVRLMALVQAAITKVFVGAPPASGTPLPPPSAA